MGNYYIDESGIEDWTKTDYFTVVACYISDENNLVVQKAVSNFRKKYSPLLGYKLKYLHGSEITYGLNQGMGKYAVLKTDSHINQRFFKEINELIQVLPFEILAVTINVRKAKEYLFQEIDKHFTGRNESYKIRNLFNNVIYPMSILINTELIRKNVNTKQESISILVEDKGTNTTVIEQRLKNRFSDVLLKLDLHIKKDSRGYHAGFELADLFANALISSNRNDKRKDFDVIKRKIKMHEIVDDRNISMYLKSKL